MPALVPLSHAGAGPEPRGRRPTGVPATRTTGQPTVVRRDGGLRPGQHRRRHRHGRARAASNRAARGWSTASTGTAHDGRPDRHRAPRPAAAARLRAECHRRRRRRPAVPGLRWRHAPSRCWVDCSARIRRLPLAFGCGNGKMVDPAGPLPAISGLVEEQVRDAAIIIKVGQDLKVPPRGWVIGVATALQESRLFNLGDLGPRNDHDSIGLFQQRPSAGWGTPEQLSRPGLPVTQVLREAPHYPQLATAPAHGRRPEGPDQRLPERLREARTPGVHHRGRPDRRRWPVGHRRGCRPPVRGRRADLGVRLDRAGEGIRSCPGSGLPTARPTTASTSRCRRGRRFTRPHPDIVLVALCNAHVGGSRLQLRPRWRGVRDRLRVVRRHPARRQRDHPLLPPDGPSVRDARASASPSARSSASPAHPATRPDPTSTSRCTSTATPARLGAVDPVPFMNQVGAPLVGTG